jgi:hypothetical protein
MLANNDKKLYRARSYLLIEIWSSQDKYILETKKITIELPQTLWRGFKNLMVETETKSLQIHESADSKIIVLQTFQSLFSNQLTINYLLLNSKKE